MTRPQVPRLRPLLTAGFFGSFTKLEKDVNKTFRVFRALHGPVIQFCLKKGRDFCCNLYLKNKDFSS